jgi:hypothetical protein
MGVIPLEKADQRVGNENSMVRKIGIISDTDNLQWFELDIETGTKLLLRSINILRDQQKLTSKVVLPQFK